MDELRGFGWKAEMKTVLYQELLGRSAEELARANGIPLEDAVVYNLRIKKPGKIDIEEIYIGNAFEMGISHLFPGTSDYILGKVLVLEANKFERLREIISKPYAEKLEVVVASIDEALKNVMFKRKSDNPFEKIPVEIAA